MVSAASGWAQEPRDGSSSARDHQVKTAGLRLGEIGPSPGRIQKIEPPSSTLDYYWVILRNP